MFVKDNSMTTAHILHTCRQENRAALIGFLPAGFPDHKATVQAAIAMIDDGVDILEIGIPYSDPVMDGPVIQEAAFKALSQGFKVRQIFEIIGAITAYAKSSKENVAVLAMTYWNPVLAYGTEKFAHDLAHSGAAGMVTPDLNVDEADDWIKASDRYGLDRVFLVAPSSSPQRIAETAAASRGFVYAAAAMNITGKSNTISYRTQELVHDIRSVSDKYVCVGIGVSTPQDARAVAQYADGVIIGSKFVQAIADTGADKLNIGKLSVLTKDFRHNVYRQESTLYPKT